jgi:1,2-dihydroxy-3-keto-5-methylthiopentene dioxygenase
MSLVREYPDDTDPGSCREWTSFADIAAAAERAGIRFERWHPEQDLPLGAAPADILAAHRRSIERLERATGLGAADVISVHPETPGHAELRRKFLEEHTHADDEVRFFVEGSGLFVIHRAPSVICLVCEKGDLIHVPAGTPHWFDMGPRPRFTCIRLFGSPEGWVARFTGSDIAARFPRMGDGAIA